MHDLSLIATIAAAFTAAWLLGLLTQWLRLSPIVGYLLAGVLIGPHTPGFVGDVHIAQQLAEVGVILLMFGVGLHFHLKDLIAVRNIAIPGAVGQSLLATLAAMAIFHAFGMPLKTGAVLGMAMAVASTVVLMRVLMDANALGTPQGHAAVGWLIVEDIFTVILLVLIPVMGAAPEVGGGEKPGFVWALMIALGKLALLVAIVMWAGSKIVPWLLVRVARLRSRELFTLTVLVFSVAIAAASYFFFGASMALGAFLAGMVVAQSPVSHQAAADALPMRDTFAVIFFVSVGMLFDPSFLWEQPMMVAAALGIVLIVKPLAALIIVAVLGHSLRTGLTVAIGLAQIGEFSFILSELARRYKLMPDEGHNVLVAAAILSITVNPLLFRSLPAMERALSKRPWLWRLLNGRAERKAAALTNGNEAPATLDQEGHVIIAGYGPVGRSVHHALRDAGVQAVIIEMNMDTVLLLKASGVKAIYGDASNPGILDQAGIARASHLVVTVPDRSLRQAMLAAARSCSATVRIVVRARYLQERSDLERGGASYAVFEEAEAAVALVRMVLADTGMHHEAAERRIQDIRLQLLMDNVENIRLQKITSVLMEWPKVQTLDFAADHREVLRRISERRFSRWPVVRNGEARPMGYLLAKDLLTLADGENWQDRIRPLTSISPETTIDQALDHMQADGANIRLVESGGMIFGIITMEDILEQVVGKLDDEQAREIPIRLDDAVHRGGMVLDLEGQTLHSVIHELVAVIPSWNLPSGPDAATVTARVIEREGEIQTDLGNGVAIPHARIEGLAAPIVVVGRSKQGIAAPTDTGVRTRLFFLVLSPLDHPEIQLALLSRIARLVSADETLRVLLESGSWVEIEEIIRRSPREFRGRKSV